MQGAYKNFSIERLDIDVTYTANRDSTVGLELMNESLALALFFKLLSNGYEHSRIDALGLKTTYVIHFVVDKLMLFVT